MNGADTISAPSGHPKEYNGLVFLLGGLVGPYIRQSEAAGKLGVVGFLLAFSGTALVEGDF